MDQDCTVANVLDLGSVSGTSVILTAIEMAAALKLVRRRMRRRVIFVSWRHSLAESSAILMPILMSIEGSIGVRVRVAILDDVPVGY